MNVYLIEYNNNEPYDDFRSWSDDAVFLSKESATKILEDNGFVRKTHKIFGKEEEYYEQIIIDTDYYLEECTIAKIKKLKVIE